MSVIKQEHVELPLHVLPHDHKAAKNNTLMFEENQKTVQACSAKSRVDGIYYLFASVVRKGSRKCQERRVCAGVKYTSIIKGQPVCR
jgi:hypothetical protein